MRCVIVDDSVDFIAAARGLLERQGVEVVGVASTIADAVRSISALRPDVTLVDIYLGAESGFDLADQLHRDGWSRPVILISTHSAHDFADMIAASPAVGFVAKSALSAGAIRDLARSAGFEEGEAEHDGATGAN
jgi:DNA-binding NarL/FixJ family response regulator